MATSDQVQRITLRNDGSWEGRLSLKTATLLPFGPLEVGSDDTVTCGGSHDGRLVSSHAHWLAEPISDRIALSHNSSSGELLKPHCYKPEQIEMKLIRT